jgi:octaprenyl-diphosphate synthase
LKDGEKEMLRSLHAKKLSSKEVTWIKTKMQEHQVIQKSYEEAKVLVLEAIALMKGRGEERLSSIAMQMIEREF